MKQGLALRAGIDQGKTVWEVISGGEVYITAGRTVIPSRAYVAAFGFKGTDQQKPARLMSGGERGRMNLALSHDRWFLDRVATHILAWEGGADWFWLEGNFAAYEQNKAARPGDEAVRPDRVTYRKLSR